MKPAATSWRSFRGSPCLSSRRYILFFRTGAGIQRCLWIGSSTLRRRSSSWPRKAGSCCCTAYGTPAEKIEIIPHGIPDFAFIEPDQTKTKFGLQLASPVILTFGLLSPTKGIEVMIDADARDPEEPRLTLSISFSEDASQSRQGLRARFTARACSAGAQNSASKTTSYSSTNSSTKRHCSTTFR